MRSGDTEAGKREEPTPGDITEVSYLLQVCRRGLGIAPLALGS